jgi:DNA-binding SARP family transcriptional activator
MESTGTYVLNPSANFDCDALEFQHLLQLAKEIPDGDPRCPDIIRSAFDLYGGAFAPVLDAEWADTIRTKLEREFLDAAARLSDILLEQSDNGGAAAVCSRLLDYDPYNEAACYRLMRAQAASGLYDSAVHTFRRYAETLERDIGDQPGRAIGELYAQIRDRLGQGTAQPP